MAQLALFMMIPTTAELRTAIEVLKALDDRINEQAAHTVRQMPNTDLGDLYSIHTSFHAIAQTNHIEKVSKQLQNWREELLEQQKHGMTQSV